MSASPNLHDVVVPLDAVLELPPLTLREILRLQAGGVLRSTLQVGGNVSISAEGFTIAEGELSIADTHVLVRLSRIGRQV